MRTLARRAIALLSLLLLLATVAVWLRAQWAGHAYLRQQLVAEPPDGLALRMVYVDLCRGSLVVRRGYYRLSSDTPFSTVLPPPMAAPATPLAPGDVDSRFIPRDPHAFASTYGIAGQAYRGFAFAGLARERTDHRRTGSQVATFALFRGRAIPVGSDSFLTVALPWWLLTLCFAVAPALAFRSWLRARRLLPHGCPHCGYDLRATTDPTGPLLPTCPECGRSGPTSAPG